MKTSKLSELSGLSVRRINQLGAESILPAKREGEFPDDEVLRALFAYFKTHAPDGARKRFNEAHAAREELKLQLESGDSIHVDVVSEAWLDLIVMMKQRLLAAGHNLESVGKITHDQRVAVDAEITGALSELGKNIACWADEIEAREKSQSSKDKSAE